MYGYGGYGDGVYGGDGVEPDRRRTRHVVIEVSVRLSRSTGKD